MQAANLFDAVFGFEIALDSAVGVDRVRVIVFIEDWSRFRRSGHVEEQVVNSWQRREVEFCVGPRHVASGEMGGVEVKGIERASGNVLIR